MKEIRAALDSLDFRVVETAMYTQPMLSAFPLRVRYRRASNINRKYFYLRPSVTC